MACADENGPKFSSTTHLSVVMGSSPFTTVKGTKVIYSTDSSGYSKMKLLLTFETTHSFPSDSDSLWKTIYRLYDKLLE